MASENEASCTADPNFAVVCAFLQKFGALCGLGSVDFIDLQKMIENSQEVPQPLLDLHLKLLRRIKKSVSVERWERVLSKLCHTYNNQDGWEIERFGYKKARISCKLRTLKTLMEMQFDCHTKFKGEINKLTAEELRSQPLGKDKLGHAYWYQIDEDCQIRVYKEDPDEETWMLVANDRDGLLSLISQLKENDSVVTGIEPVLNEDSNSLEIEKPILDTGQADSGSNQSTVESKEREQKSDLDEDTKTDSKSNGTNAEDCKDVESEERKDVESEERKDAESEERKDVESEERKDCEPEEKKGDEPEEGKECHKPDEKKDNPPKQICLRLKPMSELLNSPSAAEYKAEEEAKRKHNDDELMEIPKQVKTRKLTLMNSKPVKKSINKKRIEESSEEDEDMEEDEDDEMEDSDELGEEIEEPVMYVRGRGRGKDNCSGALQLDSEQTSPIISEEICEDVLFVYGDGSGKECLTGNENQNQTNDKCAVEQTKKSTIKLGMVIDSRTDKITESTTKSLNKKNRWDVGKPPSEDKQAESAETPKLSMFFFGPNTNTNAGISFFGSTSSPSKETDNAADNEIISKAAPSIDTNNYFDTNPVSVVDANKEKLREENHENERGKEVETMPSSFSTEESPCSRDLSNEMPVIFSTTENIPDVRNNDDRDKDRCLRRDQDMPSSTTVKRQNLDIAEPSVDKQIQVISLTTKQSVSADELKEADYYNSKFRELRKKDDNLAASVSTSTEDIELKQFEEQPVKVKSSIENQETDCRRPVSSSTYDISKEDSLEKIEPIVISAELESSATNTSNNTPDDVSKKDDNICKGDNTVISETTTEVSDYTEINSNATNNENTKESTVDSNTIITEMEIEEAMDVPDANVGDRSGESMELEDIDKGDISVGDKSGESMELEEIHEGDTTKVNLGEMIEEAKRTHSFIDTSMSKKETAANIEVLQTDLSTMDDSKISMDIEENSDSTVPQSTTSESLTISQSTSDMSKEDDTLKSTAKVIEISEFIDPVNKKMEPKIQISGGTIRDNDIEEEHLRVFHPKLITKKLGSRNKIKIDKFKDSSKQTDLVLSENISKSKEMRSIHDDNKEGVDSHPLEDSNIVKILPERIELPTDKYESKISETAESLIIPVSRTHHIGSMLTELECVKNAFSPLSNSEKAPSSKMLDCVEACIIPKSQTDVSGIEPPAIIVTNVANIKDNPSASTEPVCVKKTVAPLTNIEATPLKKPTTLEKPAEDKKAVSPMQSIESVESIDADCHAGSIDRDSEIDTAEDPFDNVGIPQDDPLDLAEEEEDEIDEAEEEEIEEEEEEINPEDLENEDELDAEEDEEDGLDGEEIEDEDVESEDEEEEDADPVVKGTKITFNADKAEKVSIDKKTSLTSFSMDFNDSSDSIHLPPMLKEKLKKRQLLQQQKIKKPAADSHDSDEEIGEEESEDEEVEEEEDGDDEDEDDSEEDEEEDETPVKLIPKGKVGNLKQVRPPYKGDAKIPHGIKAQLPSPPTQVKKPTTADLRKERKKKKSEIEILKEEIDDKLAPVSGVRQSRRIAQIKIREEAEKRKLEELTLAQVKFESRKLFEKSEKFKKDKLSSGEEYVADLDELKKKKKKKKHKHPKFDEHNPWKSSSGSSSSQEDAQEEQDDEMGDDSDHDIRLKELHSDHEFSPESDLEDDAEVKPLKRARTVRKEEKAEGDEDAPDDTPCEKCGKFDHPEWILLCDGCDHGWHCSCLRPALLVIPEGDWFCPPCQHASLLKKLEEQLVDLDKRRSKQQIEVRRKERLAYIGISLNNVLSTNDTDAKRGDKGDGKSDSSSSGSSGSTDSSDSDEPIYQLRQRRQAHSYRFNDYDDLINSAIQDEEEPEEDEEVDVPVGNQGRGKDIATIVNAEKEQREKEASITENNEKTSAKKVVKRKKKRKLNSLVVSSGEDGTSDEDFRGSSTDDEEDELEFDEPGSGYSSYDSCIGRRRRKGSGVTRRSTRARWSRMDSDFINDDSDASDMLVQPKKRRKRGNWTDDSDDLEEDEELSELSDSSWGKKRKSGKRSSSKSKTKTSKKKTQKTLGSDSDEPVQKKRRKIKFGGLNDTEDEEEKRVKVDSIRKTRGKKITYVDALGSDSEDEIRRRKLGIVEESEEEYMAEDDDGLEDEDGNEIEKDSDESDSAAATKVHIRPVSKKGKGKGGIKRIKRAQGIEDELFPPLNTNEPKDTVKTDSVTSTTSTTDTKSTSNDSKDVPKPTEETKRAETTTELVEEADPMQEINRNMESMDEKLMMEDPDYATKQLQMVAAQLERKKKEDAALYAAEAAATSEDMAKHRRGRKPKVIPYMSPAPQILQSRLETEDIQQLDNSNSPGPSSVGIPAFGELATTLSEDGSPVKKRRGRGKGKKTLEKEAAAAAALAAAATALGKEDLGTPPNMDEVLPVPMVPVVRSVPGGAVSPALIDPSAMAGAKLAIATPPQPFSQTEPAPSVITRMLQAPQTGPCPGTPPGSSSPAGPIAAGVPYGAVPHKYYVPGPTPPLVGNRSPLRGVGPHLPPGLPSHGMGVSPGGPYGPPPPSMGGMNHRPYHSGQPGPPGSALPPHMLRMPGASHSPPGTLYHHHHTMDASPSGGSAIQPMGGGSPGRIPPPGGPIHGPRAATVPPPVGVVLPPPLVPPHLSSVPPDRHSPLGHTPSPPSALIPPPGVGGGPRYPPHAPLHQPPRHHHMVVPPQHTMHPLQHGMPPRGGLPSGPIPPSPYPPGLPPPSPYYSTYPPQPGSIPPEDYHHHHHHHPLPPSHGYGQPPATTTTSSPSSSDPSIVTGGGGGGLKTTLPHDDIPPGEDIGRGIAAATEGQHDSTGEFGGLVSYFSSQREDDLDG